jgi:hypothetical protein
MLSDLVDWKTILKRVFKKWVKDINWFYLAPDRDKWRALVNTVRVPQNAENFMTS